MPSDIEYYKCTFFRTKKMSSLQNPPNKEKFSLIHRFQHQPFMSRHQVIAEINYQNIFKFCYSFNFCYVMFCYDFYFYHWSGLFDTLLKFKSLCKCFAISIFISKTAPSTKLRHRQFTTAAGPSTVSPRSDG